MQQKKHRSAVIPTRARIPDNEIHPAKGPRHCEPFGARQSIQTLHPSQSGRSMVEMLGTLAIVGVLSAGAIGGYSYAMNKHRTNELIYEATKRAQWVGTQLEMNNPNPSLNTFGTDSFGGGTFTGEVVQLENGQIGIKVAGLKEAVCQNILNSIGDNTVIREMKDVNCNNDNGTATLIFNRDLSTNDSQNGDEHSDSTDLSANSSLSLTITIVTEPEPESPSGDEECSYHGSWNSYYCVCDPGWTEEDCSQKNICGKHGYWSGVGNCTCDPGWGGFTCSTENACSGNGIWVCGSYCQCNSGWYGANCSYQDARAACNNRGLEQVRPDGSTICNCDEGWYGPYCSFQNQQEACGGHGVWAQGWDGLWECQCQNDWFGSDCSQNKGETFCNGHGRWDGLECYCNFGWIKADCSEEGEEITEETVLESTLIETTLANM